MPSICLPLLPSPSQKSSFNSYRGLREFGNPSNRRLRLKGWPVSRWIERGEGKAAGNSGVPHGTPRLILTTPDMQIGATGSMQIVQTYAGYRMRDTTMKKSVIEKKKKKRIGSPLNWFSVHARSNSVSLLHILLRE